MRDFGCIKYWSVNTEIKFLYSTLTLTIIEANIFLSIRWWVFFIDNKQVQRIHLICTAERLRMRNKVSDVQWIFAFLSSGSKCPSVARTDRKSNALPKNVNLVYEYIHPLIRLKKSPYSRDVWLKRTDRNWISKLISPVPSIRSPPSVIMIMLDAVSDLQARRALPQTLSYLRSQGLFTFQRHAIVGDGTFENIVPLLFGRPAAHLQTPNTNDSRYQFIQTEMKINPKTKKRFSVRKLVHYPGPYDDFPFIAKNFSRLNYTTFFSEEWRESAFYNLKNGFRQAPTDYYLRPYWLSLYETMSYNKYAGNSNPKPCYLNKLLHHVSLNWLEQFLQVHHQTPNYPTFGIMKMNEMSHDYLERLFWIDYDLKNFFENLFQEQLLNNTIVIFSGDHGHRQHRLRLTRIGSYEVKLPFFSVLLPPSFKQQFPQATQNMKNNEKSQFSAKIGKGKSFSLCSSANILVGCVWDIGKRSENGWKTRHLRSSLSELALHHTWHLSLSSYSRAELLISWHTW